MARLAVSLLGSFQATLDGAPLDNFRTDNARGLLCYLITRPGDYFHRDYLAALFWPDSAKEEAQVNLRQTLYRLRQAFPSSEDAQAFLISGHRTLGFNPESDYWLDVQEFTSLLDQCKTHPHRQIESCADCMERLQRALDLYQGDFLTGFSLPSGSDLDTWRTITQEELHSRAITALEQLTAYYWKRQVHSEAAAALRRLLALEPWREEDHHQLMQALALDGQPAAALRQYEICRQILASELGNEPSATTRALAEEIRQGRFPPTKSGAPAGLASLSVSAQGLGQARLAQARLPRANPLFGRKPEMDRLLSWIHGGQVQIIAIMGMGGIGKSALAVHCARALTGDQWAATGEKTAQTTVQTTVLWRSLVNAPPLSQVLNEWLQVLAGIHEPEMPASLDERLDLLTLVLAQKSALLILDNLESILGEGDASGDFRPGYEEYGQLLQILAEREQRSTLLITSRERPRLLARLERGNDRVVSLHLSGLQGEDSRRILERWALQGGPQALDRLSERYSGNPLALELIGEAVDTLYDGDVSAFLAAPTALLGSLAQILEQQFVRLSPIERSLLFWLAIEREPVALPDLRANFISDESHQEVLTALRGLLHRSLVEQQSGEKGALFYLQNVITEFATNRLVEIVCGEIDTGPVDLLDSHALLKATGAAYVVESQRRMILGPVAERLATRWGRAGLEQRLRALVERLRAAASPGRGYAAGNLLNLMLQAGLNLRGMDFSGLTIRQAHLSNALLPEINLSGASLLGCSFTEAIGQVMAAALSPDSRFLAVVTHRGELLLWRRRNHQLLAQLRFDVDSLWSVAFHPDGHQLVCAAGDGYLYFWRLVATEEQVELILTGRLAAHERVARSVAFRPDGRQLASAGEDGSVRLWAAGAETGLPFQAERTLTDHTDRVFRVVYSPDGQTLASAGADTEIRLWASATGCCLWTLRGHRERIAGLAFSPDGQTLVSGGVDRDIRVWSVESGECLRILHHHAHPLLAVAFSPDGHLLASAGHSTTVRLWETQTWQQVRQLHLGGAVHTEIWSLIFDSGGSELVVSGETPPISIWDLPSGQCTFLRRTWQAEIWAALFHPSGRWVVTGDQNGSLLVWDVEQEDLAYPVTISQGDESGVVDIAFAPQAQQMIVGSRNGSIQLWAFRVAGPEFELELVGQLPADAHSYGLSHLALTEDEQFLLAVNQWGELFIWKMWVDGRFNPYPLLTVQAHKQAVFGLTTHPQGRLAASGGDDRRVRLWEIASGASVGEFGDFQARILALDFSPDGNRLAATDAAGLLLVWDSTEKRISHRRPFPDGGTNRVKFMDNGLLAVGGLGPISLCQLEADGSVTPVRQFRGHSALIESLQPHPTRSWLVSASSDGSARLWDIRSGEPLAVWRNPGPYWGTNIRGVRGLTPAQKATLLNLGAVEKE